MNKAALSSETLHVSCVEKEGGAILLSGRSGSGKSDLALRLIDRGAVLVSDDYTVLKRVDGQLIACAPDNIAGRIEVRGLGILSLPNLADVPVSLFVDLDGEVERMPLSRAPIRIAGVDIPAIAANALEASAPIKIEQALKHFGLKP